jgi:hypothetical protein
MAVSVESPPVRRTDQEVAQLSLPRLYALRFGYLVVGGGLAVTKWPLFLQHDRPWPLFEGVVTSMLVAMSLLALLGIRYPVRMLPVLLFESAWKLIWLGTVAAPMWLGDGLDAKTAHVASTCLWVVIVVAVVPWRYVVRRYVTSPGDRWRRSV